MSKLFEKNNMPKAKASFISDTWECLLQKKTDLEKNPLHQDIEKPNKTFMKWCDDVDKVNEQVKLCFIHIHSLFYSWLPYDICRPIDCRPVNHWHTSWRTTELFWNKAQI